jgi:hypothetical protein
MDKALGSIPSTVNKNTSMGLVFHAKDAVVSNYKK